MQSKGKFLFASLPVCQFASLKINRLTGSPANRLTGFLLFFLCLFSVAIAQESKQESVIINGDTVEYSLDGKEATAIGNVKVIYKSTVLTCEKLTINMETKDAEAEGNARLDDKGGVIEGIKMLYNFQDKTGVITDSEFRSNPYFGKAEKTKKVSEEEFIALRGYMTTCSYDRPHWRIKSKKINLFPGDKVKTRDDIFYLGQVPLFCAPQYNHSLREPLMHVQLMPGKTKIWGPYLLTAWRYNLTEDVTGRIYFDQRSNMGVAEGFGLNYKTSDFGKGDYKYYYTQERSPDFDEGVPAEFQRYFIRWRHNWNVAEQTKLTSEYYKIVDSKTTLHPGSRSFLKEYFFREYEKNSQPLSYVLLHHNFSYASVDFLLQKRVNRWYSQEEKLPEIKYSLPSIQIGESRFYWENSGSYVSMNPKAAVPSPSWDDGAYNTASTTNKFSLPMKAAFFSLTPSVSGQGTYNDKGVYGATWQVSASTGSDLSTKFYRLFNVKSDFLGMDINDLRHIITPGIGYSYSLNADAQPSREIRITRSNSTRNSSASLSLSNKLQTKRKGQKVDITDFRISSSYAFNPKAGDRIGSSFSDFLFELDLLPYSWLRIDGDATYKHSGNDSDANVNYKHFSSANYDISFNFSEERSFGLGQRYNRKGGNDVTQSFKWRLSPKWKFSAYQRRNIGHDPTLKRGLREQEYMVSRDLHCWVLDFTYNVKKGAGESVWFIFRLKAFPELEFEYNQMYHAPKPGSQSNP